ncbi:MAG: dihydroorotase [bacterium]|nr:dihydroorotase [bacterium]
METQGEGFKGPILIKGVRLLNGGSSDILIEAGKIKGIGGIEDGAERVIPAEGLLAVPGLIDLHTHIREQGEGTETIETATEAAISGGFSCICMMPNTIPIIDSVQRLRDLKQKIKKDALVSILPIPSIAISMGQSELADIEGFAKEGVFAISDDGHTIHNLSLLRKACLEAKRLGLLVILHAEDEKGEPEAVEKRIELAYLTGAKVHIAHISTMEGVKLVREAKKSRINVTTEATPHHFTLTEEDIKDTNFKVNPRLMSHKDREAIREGLADGTIDIIATDHAPHTKKAKEGGWDVAAPGMVGLETCLGLVWTELVKTGILSERLAIEKLTTNPARIIGITENRENLLLIDPDKEWSVNPLDFKSKGRNTPFSGRRLKGKVILLTMPRIN